MAFDAFGGVDFSGAKEPLDNLWAAVGVEREGRLHVVDLRPLPFREDLKHHVAGGWRELVRPAAEAPILWGLDFPLGLPVACSMMLGEARPTWEATLATVAAMADANALRATCDGMSKAPRETDRCGGLAPLDLRLYKQTFEGLRWLHEMRQAHEVSVLPQAAKERATTTLVEVYPSVTRTDLGVKPTRVPRRPGEVRARPAALGAWLTFDHPSMAATAAAIEDAWDATLACLTAWLVRDHLDQPKHRGGAAVELEGWIYRHPAALESGR